MLTSDGRRITRRVDVSDFGEKPVFKSTSLYHTTVIIGGGELVEIALALLSNNSVLSASILRSTTFYIIRYIANIKNKC